MVSYNCLIPLDDVIEATVTQVLLCSIVYLSCSLVVRCECGLVGFNLLSGLIICLLSSELF
jgi:hypothetical protein